MVDIKFHCDEKNNFKKEISVRAFTYTDYSIEMHNHDFSVSCRIQRVALGGCGMLLSTTLRCTLAD